MLRSAWITLLLLYCGEVFSQRYPFINYTPNDGLVNNAVRVMRQDSQGRLYFLTKAGMSVYDSARFTSYSTSEVLALKIVNDILEITACSFGIAGNAVKAHCLVGQKIK